jgi:hypothetical protein
MVPIDHYAQDAERLSESAFVGKHGDLFLLKNPSSVDSEWDKDIQYQTVFAGPSNMMDLEDQRIFDASWRIAAVRKKPQNPFPERISVGRAKNCDVVIRLPHISKLHAHFMVGGKALKLVNNNSSNGTSVNGHKLTPGEAMPIALGDKVDFGGVEAELVGGSRIYRLLRNAD